MRLDEPVQVVVTTVGGDLVAQLVVDPRKPVLNIKTQLAGIEGTPVSNQVLLLNDRALNDAVRLAEQAADESQSIQLVMVRRPPLLSGKLVADDLEELLLDAPAGKSSALERAIDAYAENPLYSKKDLEAIVAAVAQALLPPGHALADILGEADLSAMDARNSGSASSRASCRAAFVSVLRTALLGVQRRLHPGQAEEAPVDEPKELHGEEARIEDTKEEFKEASDSTRAEEGQEESVDPEPETPEKTEAMKGLMRNSWQAEAKREVVEGSPEPESHYPWKGANRELQEKLQRRWSQCEAPRR